MKFRITELLNYEIMKTMKKFENFQNFSLYDTLIVAVSGGPDSVALLDMVSGMRDGGSGTSIIVAHVNHGIRGFEADRDEKFVRVLAKKYGLKCEVKCVQLAGKTGQEEKGRKIRRDFFERLRKKYKARWILTAHTEDDQIETIVFNFLRGSGPAGLAGMQMVNGYYVKPLLGLSKAEILAYLKARKIKYCKDRTNEETHYRRNFLRKRILPLFKKINPNFRQTLIRNAQTFREIHEWLEKEATFTLRQAQGDNQQALGDRKRKDFSFSAKKILALPPAIQSAALQLLFQKFSRQSYRLPSKKISEIQRLLSRNIGRKRVGLGKGIWISLEKGQLKLMR